jgi:flagellar hook assembly protein FlgD
MDRQLSVNLSIYNLSGQKVHTLIRDMQESGYYQYIWNANNCAAGIYFAVLSIDNKIFSTQKMLYVK